MTDQKHVSPKFQRLIAQTAAGMRADYDEAVVDARNKRIAKSGLGAEASWKNFLEAWGPGLPVVLRKYVVGPRGETSNEVDLLVLKPDYPEHLRDRDEILYSGVLAAFSCKSTLKPKHLAEAVAQKKLLLDIGPSERRTPLEEIRGEFPFGLLTHSSPKSKDTAELQRSVTKKYNKLRMPGKDGVEATILHPSQELDCLVVADSAFFQTIRSAFVPAAPELAVLLDSEVTSMFVAIQADEEPSGYPLVRFITWLAQQIDPNNASTLQTLTDHFGGPGAGFGQAVKWQDIVLLEAEALYNQSVGHDVRGTRRSFG